MELNNVRKAFGPFTALNDVNLKIEKGEILTLLGPSGCGKTTLMRIIAGFEEPTKGELLIGGVDATHLPPERRSVNMVFQRYALFPHLDVFDNVAFGLRLRSMPEKEVKSKVLAMLHLVQLDSMANRWINELSGGQSQRVALARALVNHPDVLLLDEPLAALDLKIRHHMLKELRRIHDETGTTFVYVTHDQDEAMILSDRVVLMNKGQIEQLGSPQDLYGAPETLFCAKFFGETNILEGQVTGVSGGVADIQSNSILVKGIARKVKEGESVSLSIRPESVNISEVSDGNVHAEMNSIVGTLEDVTFIGSRVVYQVRTGNASTISCQETRPVSGVRHKPGEQVRLSWSPEAVVVLNQ